MALTVIKTFLRLLRSLVRDHIFWVTKKVLFEARFSDIYNNTPTIPISYRFGNQNDINSLRFDDHDYDDDAKKFAHERLLAKDLVVVGEYDGKIVFYGWLMFGFMKLDSRSYIPIPLDTVYVYRCFTVKAFRGKRILPGFYAYIKHILRDMGYQKVICYVVAGNKSSLKSHKRDGFNPTGTIYSIRLMFHIFHLVSGRDN